MSFINSNIKKLKPSATLAINQKVTSLREQGEQVFHFGFGQSPFPIHKSIVETLKENASNNNYLPTVGLGELRVEIANFLNKYQGIPAYKDQIYIGPGSKELLYQSVLLFEGVYMIPKGSWVSYGPQIESKNGTIQILNTEFKNNFKLEPKELELQCKQHSNIQKILIINSPNNPTGAVYTLNELEALTKVCRANNVIVFSDEIYSQINFNESFSPSIASLYPEKTIVFGGLSKVFSAGGYRLGFMCLPKELEFLHSNYRALFSETFSAVSSPVQFAGVEAYRMKPDLVSYVSKNVEILKAVSSYIFNSLSQIGIECTQPQGAFYMMIGFNKFKGKINALGIHTSEELSIYLLEKFKVALLPGTDFYFSSEELFFRLAFVDFDGVEAMKINKSGYSEFIKNKCFNIMGGVESLKKFVASLG